MKRKFLVASFVTISSLLIFSCSKDKGSNDNNPPSGGGGGGTTTPGPLFIAVRTVVQTNCATNSGCHAGANPTGGHNFSTDATIVAQKDRIKVRAVDQAGTPSQMPLPPNAPLSTADQKKITDWLTAGGAITN
ncbi:MAG: hypothetical protein JWR72_3468 [Flavisolibacter sp.]|jgi:uncharacterized membrane protein|nr:hypothetical protein [Flavisolibacter sp.]